MFTIKVVALNLDGPGHAPPYLCVSRSMRIVICIISVIVLLLLISYGLLFYFSTSIKFGAYDGVNFGSLTFYNCSFKNETVDAIARKMLSPINRNVIDIEEIPIAIKDKLVFALDSYRVKRK